MMRIKKYLSPAGVLNKRYTDEDFQGTGWHYIPVLDIKPDDKLRDTALKQGEQYYLADENGNLVPSKVVNNFLKNLGLTTAYDYYYDLQTLAPISKNLNPYFNQQYDANDRISQLMRLRALDRKANRKTPGVGTFVVAPLTAIGAGIGGAVTLPYLLPGTIGGNIIGTTAFGEALNHAIKYGTGKTMGEHAVNAAHYLGIPESLWGDFGIQMIGDMPLYVGGDLIGKAVENTGRTLSREALNQAALLKSYFPTTKDLSKAMNEALDKGTLTERVPTIINGAPTETTGQIVLLPKTRTTTYIKPWKSSWNNPTNTKYNTATSLELEGRPQQYFEAVADLEPGNISVHFKTDGQGSQGSLTAADKQALFTGLNELIPEGSRISTYGSVSPGGVHGLNRLAAENEYAQVGTRMVEDKTGNALEIPVFYKPLNSHLQGEDAIRMFKEYGGESIPEGSINGELLRKYVSEARERYGLIGNTDITDEEIAQALYKHVKELGGNTAAVNALGEPLLLFRGDTRPYTELKERMSPEKLAEKSGTMDNSLGTLFLGEFPNRFQGADRYIGTWRSFNGSLKLIGSGTGSKVIFDGKTASEIEGAPIIGSKFGGGYKLYSHPMRHGNIEVYKLPASMMESGVNDLNAFVVRTPAVRDATPEISVLNDDWLVKGAVGSKPHMSTKLIYDKDGFPLYQHADGTTTPALAGMDNRPGMAEHYRFVLDDAKNKGEGLLRSDKNAPLRDEHTLYTYFALPNFNIRGAKHILPYDLRIPRNWNDPNIYRSVLPFVLGGSALYGITPNRKSGKLIKRK